VPVVAEATRKAYVHRARKVTGWPPLRWVRRFRPDPLARLHLGESDGSESSLSAATSIGPASPAALAGVSLALRDTAGRMGEQLPTPWREPLLAAVRSKMDDVPDALDQAVARTDLKVVRTRRWWRAVGLLQWLAVAVTAAGLLWLGVRYVLFALALPEPPIPQVGRVPLPTALLIGVRAAVDKVARDLIAGPASEVIQTYGRAREALLRARG
jgi:hypothetical protein